MVDNDTIGKALSILEHVAPPTDEEESFNLTLAEPRSVTVKTELPDVIDADVEVANNVLKALHVGWSTVRTISSLCKLADSTLSALERRRKLLNLQYGAKVEIHKTDIVYPMD